MLRSDSVADEPVRWEQRRECEKSVLRFRGQRDVIQERVTDWFLVFPCPQPCTTPGYVPCNGVNFVNFCCPPASACGYDAVGVVRCSPLSGPPPGPSTPPSPNPVPIPTPRPDPVPIPTPRPIP